MIGSVITSRSQDRLTHSKNKKRFGFDAFYVEKENWNNRLKIWSNISHASEFFYLIPTPKKGLTKMLFVYVGGYNVVQLQSLRSPFTHSWCIRRKYVL